MLVLYEKKLHNAPRKYQTNIHDIYELNKIIRPFRNNIDHVDCTLFAKHQVKTKLHACMFNVSVMSVKYQ